MTKINQSCELPADPGRKAEPPAQQRSDSTEQGQTEHRFNFADLINTWSLAYVSSIALLGLGALTKMLLARSLPPRDLGLLLTAQAIVALATTLAQLSVPEALIRFIGFSSEASLRGAAGLVRKALWLTVGGSFIVLFAMIAGAPVLAGSIYHQTALAAVLIILAFALPLNAVAVVLASAYRGLGRIWEKILYTDLIPTIFIIGALAILKFLGRSSLINISGLYLFAVAISSSLIIRRFKTDDMWKVEPARASAKSLLRFGAPLAAASLMAWPMAFIPLMLGARDLRGVAYYNLAIALSTLIYTPVGAAEIAALPVWSNQIINGRNLEMRSDYASTTSWCLIVGSAVFAVLFFCPAEIIKVVYGEQYLDGVGALRWIAPILLLNAATGPNESLLKALGSTKWIFIVKLSCGLGVIAGTLIWRTQGALTRAIGSFWISALTGIVMYSAYLFVRRGIHPVTAGYLKTWIAIICSFTIVTFCRRWIHVNSSVITILITFGLYSASICCLLWATGYGSSADATKLRSLFRGLSVGHSARAVVREEA